MFLGNRKLQRLTVGVVIGVVVISLALSLVSAGAATPGAREIAGHGAVASPTPTPGLESLGSSGDPRPVTKTPQGTATQVSDREHLGGLVAFIAFMLGGVLLLVRGRRRDRREAREARESSILS